MKIVAFYSIKGGVGKTAAAVNLAWLAASRGSRVLLVDLDPQGAASFYLDAEASKKQSSETLLKSGKPLRKQVKSTAYKHLDILPSDMSYRNLDIELDAVKKSRKRLHKVFEPLAKDYDYLFLDCPPNVTLLSENVFHAADRILAPLIPTTLSLMTYEKLQGFFAERKIDRSILTPFFSLVDNRKRMHWECMEALLDRDPQILSTEIPDASDVEKMGEHRAPLLTYAASSYAAAAYRRLWGEMLERGLV